MLKKNNKGFTLIEIVIVIAIAALILVGVLLAVQGAQKNRRDSQRKNDASRIAAQLEQYASNHSGTYPDNTAKQADFQAQLSTVGIKNPTNNKAYSYTWVTTPAKCTSWTTTTTGVPSSANHITIAVNGRQYAVLAGQESGDFFCANN